MTLFQKLAIGAVMCLGLGLFVRVIMQWGFTGFIAWTTVTLIVIVVFDWINKHWGNK